MKRLLRTCALGLALGICTFLSIQFPTLLLHITTNDPQLPGRSGNCVGQRDLGPGPEQDTRWEVSDTGQRRLIVLAYMRTGSSMTGSIFNSHPDVFYWYEPLHAMGRVHGYNHRHEDKWIKRNRFSNSDEATGNVSALLSCDVNNVFMFGLLDNFMQHSAATNRFWDCFKTSHINFLTTGSSAAWNTCVSNLTAVCTRNYSVVALKTIRLRMTRALDLMKQDPNLRIVHLVRDPRAVLESRHRLGAANYSDLKAEAYNLCSDMTNDLDAAKGLTSIELSRRYMLVRYEDIAASPTTMAGEFFKLIGLEPKPETLNFVEKLAKRAPGKRKHCETCKATVANSTARSQEWRYTSTIQDIRVIADECFQLMSLLGYQDSFKDEAELWNFEISALGKPKLNVASAITQR